MQKTEILKVRISKDLKTEANAAAEDLGESLAVFTRGALRRAVDEHHARKSAHLRLQEDLERYKSRTDEHPDANSTGD